MGLCRIRLEKLCREEYIFSAPSQHLFRKRDFGSTGFLLDDDFQILQNRYCGLLSDITIRSCRAHRRQPDSRNRRSQCPFTSCLLGLAPTG
uniref:Uncharacterized protein n=1 Tax=Candidatus Kentrum sp. LFY TaxID=2126342 RepID=A0A450WRW7_9GAMM|nr:MAG: hypothetical protein BECKLFY1418C_GA0070996_106210 [Candidatus Kentron sp. LFY]